DVGVFVLGNEVQDDGVVGRNAEQLAAEELHFPAHGSLFHHVDEARPLHGRVAGGVGYVVGDRVVTDGVHVHGVTAHHDVGGDVAVAVVCGGESGIGE